MENTPLFDNDETLDIKMAFEDDEQDSEKYKGSRKQSDPKSKTPVLDSFSRDITKLAEEGKIDPIVGREKEILRVSQILARKKKNNPILIGEPGCVHEDTLITVRKLSEISTHKVVVI
jgi:ATP-dependent Clp protease ATP-binding subunit ClpC